MRGSLVKLGLLCACVALAAVAFTPGFRFTRTAAVAPHLSPVMVTDKVDPVTKEPMGELGTFPSDTVTLYAAVQASVPPGTEVAARWYIGGNHVPKADFTYIFEKGYRGWIAPSASLGGQPWPSATYRVEFFVNDRLAVHKEFVVK